MKVVSLASIIGLLWTLYLVSSVQPLMEIFTPADYILDSNNITAQHGERLVLFTLSPIIPCPPCLIMMANMLLVDADFPLVKTYHVDVDKIPNGPIMMALHQVTAIPTLVFYYNGQPEAIIKCEKPYDVIKGVVNAIQLRHKDYDYYPVKCPGEGPVYPPP